MKKITAIISAVVIGLAIGVSVSAPVRASQSGYLECAKQCYKVFNKRSDQEHCEDRCWASHENN